MLNFCAILNQSYLLKGLALHYSLMESSPAFHLYIFTLDEGSFRILSERKLENATIIQSERFEDEALLQVKAQRSVSEYCWTCKPFILQYCFEHYNLGMCTYLDTDTYFYNDPQVIFEEAVDSSVIITPHNYHPDYDQSSTSGIYCAQFVMFKNDAFGMQVLSWWRNACLKWCSRNYEDGKWADQKYLDSWPYMFNNVHICRNKGAGLAPWNLLNHNYTLLNGQLLLDGKPLIFFHFHDVQKMPGDSWYIGNYKVPEVIVTNIYRPYIKKLNALHQELRLQYPDINTLNTTNTSPTELTAKYKIGIYRLNLQRSFGQFFDDLFFISKRRYYWRNYIKL